eukprot:TRINITY_DN2515_c0_g1_i1.p1 TRINITY_DN2515_c0_g1~~TRINITY_DN2515_c0_g1_i1.p1  ORF type:complete len:438 (-),score=113.83 TRINITY_DN2515_c0_g1_i1:487-1758(-)
MSEQDHGYDPPSSQEDLQQQQHNHHQQQMQQQQIVPENLILGGPTPDDLHGHGGHSDLHHQARGHEELQHQAPMDLHHPGQDQQQIHITHAHQHHQQIVEVLSPPPSDHNQQQQQIQQHAVAMINFSQQHINILKDIITSDGEFRHHFVYSNPSTKPTDDSTETWRRLVERMSLETNLNLTREQIEHCLNNIRDHEYKQKEKMQEVGELDPITGEKFEFWLTVDNVDVKSEPKKVNVPTGFTREEKEQLRSIITGDSELRSLIFHASSMTKEHCNQLWDKLVNKLNESTGKTFTKVQIHALLASKTKHKDKKNSKTLHEDDTYLQDFWMFNDANDSSGCYTSTPVPTPGLDSFLALMKGEGQDDMYENNPELPASQTSFLKALLPGTLEAQRLKRNLLELQCQNLKLQNKKLKMQLKKEGAAD